MDERERLNLIHVLDRAVDALKSGNVKELRNLSNQTVHDAAVYQDEFSVTIAVLIYSLGKIHEREMHYSGFKGWKKYCDVCSAGLESAKNYLIKSDMEAFSLSVKKYVDEISKLDTKLKQHIQDVLQKARINKASRLYEHGLSLGRTAELLGISRFDLMDYIGKTYIADVKENLTINAKKRLDFARGLFS